MISTGSNMNRVKLNRLKDKLFRYLGIAATLLAILSLAVFIGNILIDGAGRLSWDFLSSLPSRKPEKAGIMTAMAGSIWVLVLTALTAVPIGIAAGIYLEEYGKKNYWTRLIEINIGNLAGVPSIIYGLLGLQVFVRVMGFGYSILSGSLTLSLLVLPILIVTTRESLRAVPNSLREASYALGASKWQTIYHQILPASFGGIITGVILSISRAVGEAAPLIVVGALAYVPFVPRTPLDEFSVLPIQIFNWTSRPQHGFIINAAAGIIVLLIITFVLNGIAVVLRNRWQKKIS